MCKADSSFTPYRTPNWKSLYKAHTSLDPDEDHGCPNGHGSMESRTAYSCRTCHYVLIEEPSDGIRLEG